MRLLRRARERMAWPGSGGERDWLQHPNACWVEMRGHRSMLLWCVRSQAEVLPALRHKLLGARSLEKPGIPSSAAAAAAAAAVVQMAVAVAQVVAAALQAEVQQLLVAVNPFGPSQDC